MFTGVQAKEAGLVDELGNYYDALGYAGTLIHADPDKVATVTYDDAFSWDQLLSGRIAAPSLAEGCMKPGRGFPSPS